MTAHGLTFSWLMQNKHLVVLSGAGISAESGLSTFRDAGGLWEGHDINEVASIDGWRVNPAMVLKFYNLRRRQLKEVEPNLAHQLIAGLEDSLDVTVITQNVDDLHERSGSTKVIHLHGELRKGRSEVNTDIEIEIGYEDIKLGDKTPDGHQMRPAIVWFGEMVPMIESAASIVSTADILLVIGTSLSVYPAAGLVNYAPEYAKKFIIDPSVPDLYSFKDWKHIQKSAAKGMEELVKEFLKKENYE